MYPDDTPTPSAMAPGMLSSLHNTLVMQLMMLDNCVMMLGHLHGLVNQLVTACLCPSPSRIPLSLTYTHDSQPTLAIFALLNAPHQKSIYSKPQLAPCPPCHSATPNKSAPVKIPCHSKHIPAKPPFFGGHKLELTGTKDYLCPPSCHDHVQLMINKHQCGSSLTF